jgi:hypothetical protein
MQPGDTLPLPTFFVPFLDRTAWKLRECAVVGHQHGVDAQGVCADQEIHRLQHPAFSLGFGLSRPVDLLHCRIPQQDVGAPEEFPDRLVERRGKCPMLWSLLSAVSCERAIGAQLWFSPPTLLYATTIRPSAAEFKRRSSPEACFPVKTRDGRADTVAQSLFMTSYSSV